MSVRHEVPFSDRAFPSEKIFLHLVLPKIFFADCWPNINEVDIYC